jgi:glucosyl-3-phosphoglycerate synthase
MADFYQNGIITTLHNLSNRPARGLEAGARRYSRVRPMGLLLPSLFSELEGEALPRISTTWPWCPT